MNIQSLIQELKSQSLSTHDLEVRDDEASIKYYGKDWTTYFDIKASCVVFPTTTEQVVEVVKWARKNKVGLVPSGGRTGLSGAAVATQHEAVISFEKMNQILEFDQFDKTVRLQPGVITETLQEYAKEKGLCYPVDFAARGSSHIGGNIATNAGGIKVVRYGLTRQWVAGLKVVTGGGEVLELNKSLIKNATGLDFRHLFIGSEGILGFIVEATIQLSPAPPQAQVFVLGASGLDSIMNVFNEFSNRVSLTAFEMFSDKALNKVIEATHLPRPFDAVCDYYIVAEVETPTEESQNIALSAFEACLEKGWLVDGAISQSDSQAKNFWRLREDISESLSKYSPYKNDISVRISKVPAFMKELELILNTNYPTWEVIWFGHIGDGNLHINILRPDGMSKEEFVKECQKVDKLVFSSIQNFSGSISAEHGVGLTKKMFLGMTRSPAEIELMKQIKKIFDPDSIMNPGKVI